MKASDPVPYGNYLPQSLTQKIVHFVDIVCSHPSATGLPGDPDAGGPSTPNVGYLTGTTVCFLRSRNWVFKCHLKWPSDLMSV